MRLKLPNSIIMKKQLCNVCVSKEKVISSPFISQVWGSLHFRIKVITHILVYIALFKLHI